MGILVTMDDLANPLLFNKKVVMQKRIAVSGCFDILHVGHVRFLNWASGFGTLFVGLNSDASVRELKGSGRPFNNQLDRAEVLCALSAVSVVVIFDELRPDYFLRICKPDILVKSKKYDKPDSQSKLIVESFGGKVEYFNDVNGYSTSEIADKIARQQIGIGEY